MRVEQRIGRIDRIGQVHDAVWIRNYFYKETVEARIYQALAHRINWFEGVVGDLQPILARVGRAIERVVMAAPDEREQVLAGELDEIERGLDQKDSDILNVYEGSEIVHPWTGLAAPITLPELEHHMVQAQYLWQRLKPNPELADTYLLDESPSQRRVTTFDPAVFDQFPNTVCLLSYGSHTLETLLNEIPGPESRDDTGVLRLSIREPIPLTGYYVLNQQGQPVLLQTLRDLLDILDAGAEGIPWPDTALDAAKADFELRADTLNDQSAEIVTLQQNAARATLIEEAFQVLYRAAWVQAAQNIPEEATDQLIRVNEAMLRKLAQHKYPFSALLRLVGDRVQGTAASHLAESNAPNMSTDQLKREFSRLKDKGQVLLIRWSQMAKPQSEQLSGHPISETFFGSC